MLEEAKAPWAVVPLMMMMMMIAICKNLVCYFITQNRHEH
jgi:hypothetical protein